MVPPCNNGEESSVTPEGQSPPQPQPQPQLTIAYGSETGVAQDAALTLYNFARSHGLNCRFGSLDEAGIVALETASNLPSNQPQQLLIAACSTTGQGDPPANMKKFWRTLMSRQLAPGCLHSNESDSSSTRLRFCLIGFGDSSYLQYNFVAKKLHRRLVILGAESIFPLALANDQDPRGADQAFLPFAEQISALLTDTYRVRCACVGSCLDAPLEPLYRVEQLMTKLKSTTHAGDTTDSNSVAVASEDFSSSLPSYRLPSPETGFQLARVIVNKRLTAEDHFQDTRLITLSPVASASQNLSWPSFQPGAVLQVLPSNSAVTVDSLLKSTLSHLDPETRLVLHQSDPNFPPPSDIPPDGVTLRWLLTHYFDISCVPRRSFFETLRRIAMGIGDQDQEAPATTESTSSTDRLEMEIERLGEFVRDVDELIAYCNRPRRTVAETLRDFPMSASKIRLSRLFDLLRPIQPRSFSIASLGEPRSTSLDLLVAVVCYRSSLMSEPRLGLCSNYLAGTKTGSLIAVRLQAGTIRVPPAHVPLILVGPGTGVAPFRGLVQQRHGPQADNEAQNTQTVLYFGCRHPDKDFYFQSEWSALATTAGNNKDDDKDNNENCRFQLVTAFSRPSSDSSEGKRYVQDKIRERGAEVARLLLRDGGGVIVAGSSGSMPREVLAAVKSALMVHGGCDDATAEGLLTDWQRAGRYQMETWS